MRCGEAQMIDVNKVLALVDEFPTLPTIYSQLIEITGNPHSTVLDVARIIEQDQASSTKILKAVNSSVYGLQTKISTISQAIFHLGFNEVKNLVISLSLIKMVENKKGFDKLNLVEFWKHSIGVGIITRNIGISIKASNIEDYMISGIIHDIGKLVFVSYFSDVYQNMAEKAFNDNVSIRSLEKENFGTTNSIIGTMLAEKWKLPEQIRRSIRYQSLGVDQNSKLTASVHLANIIARMMNLGNPGDPIVPKVNPVAMKILDLPENAILEMRKKNINDYEQATSILLV